MRVAKINGIFLDQQLAGTYVELQDAESGAVLNALNHVVRGAVDVGKVVIAAALVSAIIRRTRDVPPARDGIERPKSLFRDSSRHTTPITSLARIYAISKDSTIRSIGVPVSEDITFHVGNRVVNAPLRTVHSILEESSGPICQPNELTLYHKMTSDQKRADPRRGAKLTKYRISLIDGSIFSGCIIENCPLSFVTLTGLFQVGFASRIRGRETILKTHIEYDRNFFDVLFGARGTEVSVPVPYEADFECLLDDPDVHCLQLTSIEPEDVRAWKECLSENLFEMEDVLKRELGDRLHDAIRLE